MKAWKYLPTSDDRPSIVLLPGMTGHQVILKQLAKSLMTRFNVYTIDSLGYGESSGMLGAPNKMMNSAVESVEKLMIEFELDETQTIIAGHSLGGMIAQNVAMKHPKWKGVDLGHVEVQDTVAIEQERLMARMALSQTRPDILYMAIHQSRNRRDIVGLA